MAKYAGPVCKLCRREGEKLFLKGQRCYTPKCSFERRGFPPGEHGRDAQFRRRRVSDYSRQLREKQKTRRVYGVTERQFRRYYRVSLKRRGLTGENLLQMLERRLDNVVYRLGFAPSRAAARMLVTHGHFNINGRRTDVPSMIVRPGDSIDVRPGSRRRPYFKELPEIAETRTVPRWLERDAKGLTGKVVQDPERGDIDANLSEQLIIEYYSR
ncbi:MAG: 30S ribosomal protein S4 [Chloroflexi bacterium RBG_19FT_COMBO_62_14]|jgi:small subunit ribosomal protein S4|uniref:Small ribosomal subunit protein uS4 n=1 Tax=uncultured Chloroflexi bacterium Rifle_16ft_4_minimus_38099 TaxID=1665073 RepID=A0A0H4TAS7_9CHLR|nr:30S ribosomal protein S4, small subunit ribosomal protein S4 [uncultured Chloroflexi bacterium Rifle_16ft_4_minimus_38099]OGO69167.1 MAG: 30S ribosomal protein S4 [Chloroflexi bacterium RBG_19FT_COMBO_62_14]